MNGNVSSSSSRRRSDWIDFMQCGMKRIENNEMNDLISSS